MTISAAGPADAPTSRRDRSVVAVIVLAGALWGAFQLRGSWFFFDEWSMIRRVVTYRIGDGTTRSFNGHLWVLQDLVYRAQVHWFGLDSHGFVVAVMVAALALSHVSLTWLFRVAGLPVVLSALLGGLLTYLGSGAENVTFAIQSSPVLALATSPATLALVVSRAPTRRALILATVGLLAAATLDSGIAIIGLALVAPAVPRCWGRRHTLVLAPAVVLHGCWLAFADRGPSWPGTVGRRLRFSVDLVNWSFGSLVGSPRVLGPVVAMPMVALVIAGWRRRLVSHRSVTFLWCGAAATVVAVAAIAQTRADLVGSDWFSSNRYVQVVTVLLTIGLTPAAYESWRGFAQRRTSAWPTRQRSIVLSAAPIALVAGAFVGGLSNLSTFREGLVGRSTTVHHTLDATAAIVRDGCPHGRHLDPTAVPNGALNPAVDVALVSQLVALGVYRVPDGVTADPALVELVCPVD